MLNPCFIEKPLYDVHYGASSSLRVCNLRVLHDIDENYMCELLVIANVEIQNKILPNDQYSLYIPESKSKELIAYSSTRQQSHLALVLQGPRGEVNDAFLNFYMKFNRKKTSKKLDALTVAKNHNQGVVGRFGSQVKISMFR